MAPRLHYENGELNIETFQRDTNMEAISAWVPNGITKFHEPNLYFGGVNCAVYGAKQHFDGAGDPRRGGVCLFA